MNIAWVVPGGVDRSGTERVIPALLWLLQRIARQHAVTVIALHQDERAGCWDLLGARIVNVGGRPRRLRGLAALRREHRRSPFDLVHAFWAIGAGGVAALFAGIARRPFAVHVAGGELVAIPDIGYGGGRRARDRFEARRVLARAHAVTAASEAVATQVEALGLGCERVPLGVDRAGWPGVPPRPRTPDRPARLVHVASLNPVKDQGTLLHACAHLARDGVAFTLDVVGEDTLGGAMQRLARSLDLTQVRFHGFLPHSALRPMVAGSDLLVVSSRHEAGPVALAEAAVCGVPTVGTAVGHVADLAPRAAAAVGVGDADALARAVADLLADDDRRLALARAAQGWALAHDADWTAERVLAIYRRMTESPA